MLHGGGTLTEEEYREQLIAIEQQRLAQRVGPGPLSPYEMRYRLFLAVLWPMVATFALGVAFFLADKKIPDAPRYWDRRGSPLLTQSPVASDVASTPDAPPAARALVLSAIERYSTMPANIGRSAIPAGELLNNVIDPLAKTGLIASEAGKQVLTATLDGGKALATDYFHQRWAAEFGDKAKAKDNLTPAVVCSPVFNAAPVPVVTPRTPTAKRPTRHRSQPRLCSSPKLSGV